MSDPNAPFSRVREQRLRKRCLDKKISAQDLWPNIRLHGIKLQGIKLPIRLHGIKLQDIMPHGARLLSISGLSRDLFLPIKMANPSTSKNRRRWRMINTIGSYLFGCRA